MTDITPFIERDISWLSFNGRVLQEAKDPTVPLYERIKFLAIYSSNLDEFFRVRVASLRSFRKLKKKTRRAMDLKPNRLLKQIRKTVDEQQSEFGRIFREELIPQLAANKIHLVDNRQYTDLQKEFAINYFKENIEAGLKTEIIKEGSVPFFKNKAIYLIVKFAEEDDLISVHIPDQTRFVTLPSDNDQYYVTFVDDILRIGLRPYFSDKKIEDTFSVKMSRDAEMYIDDEFEGDLLEKIKKGLKEREIGLPARFLYDASMPKELLKKIKTLFKLTKNDLIPGARYHNFNDFFGFPDPSNNSDLHNAPLPPLPHPELKNIPHILSTLDENDYLIHFPFQEFSYTTKLIEEAANDPEVDYIKVTLYRVASDSAVAKGLLKALQNGKKVVAFIEIKARFDEESNLFWGNKLSEAGAKVRYSFPGIKVHTKLLVIGKKEGKKIKNYAYIATGNFNEKTAKIYSDFALLTSNGKITDEAEQVFQMLEGNVILPKTKNILVAPHTLRKGFIKLIDKEIANAKNGKAAWMILKMNSLEDEEMMEKLIAASQAGVKIKMIVRGICRLVPGIAGMTENIEITSIVDRFLEHARVYIFCAGGKEKMFLASADWMTRNLSRRVEIAFPILDINVKKKVMDIMNLQLNDNVKARIIDGNGLNNYVNNNEEKVRAQIATYDYLKS
ncbi:MAG: polyphosphate kinase 1 [Bacteroidota bacterium]